MNRALRRWIEALGARTRRVDEGAGRAAHFAIATASASRDVSAWGPESAAPARSLGVDSLPIALFIAIFTGIVLSLLASYSFTGAVPLYFAGTLIENTITMELTP